MLGERIKEFRVEKGMTQQFLADKMEVHRVTVAKWENGEYTPRLSTVTKLANTLNKELKDFFVK